MPRVYNLKTERDAIPPGWVYIGRDRGRRNKWRNPFRIGLDGTRAEVIAKYRDYLEQQMGAGVLNPEELRGKDLGCFCYPQPCHGDILFAYANERRK